MPSRLSAFVIWALVGASVLYWVFGLWASGPKAPAYTVPLGDTAVLRGDLDRLLGTAPAAPGSPAPQSSPDSQRFRLVGVMAPRKGAPAGQGIALLSIDGKPARPFRVGRAVDRDLVLREVALRSATIGPAGGGSSFKLELPARQAPATGVLSSLPLTQGGDAGALPPPPPRAPPGPDPQQLAQQQLMLQQQQQEERLRQEQLMQQQMQQQMLEQQQMQQMPPPEAPPPLPVQ